MTAVAAGKMRRVEVLFGSVFEWDLQICAPLAKSYESPSFWSTDPLIGVDHEWRLEFCSSTYEDTVSIQHLGNAQEESSVFAVRFRVLTSGLRNQDQQVWYDDLQQELTQVEKSSKELSTSGHYTISIGTYCGSVPYRMKILCKIIGKASSGNIKQGIDTLNDHDSSLKTEYELLFESGKFSDVTFIVDKQKLHLHKSILSHRSVVFAAMFDHDFKENKSDEVFIEDSTLEVMREFFRYVYAGKVKNIKTFVRDLLIVSEKYAVNGLKTLCERRLIKALTVQNAIESVELANHHNAKLLESECVKFIVSNAKEIAKIPKLDLSKLPSDVFKKLFIAFAGKL